MWRGPLAHPQEVDHRADIYALGVVFYQMLTGQFPAAPLQPPSTKVIIDVRLDEVVLRALSTSPDLRYQQANEFKTSVENLSSIPQTAPSGPPESPLRSSRAYISSPEYFATTAGPRKLLETRGELALFPDRLVFVSGPQRCDIPLRSIRALTLANYPMLMNLIPHRFISLDYEEAGQIRHLILTPSSPALTWIWTANRRVIQWFLAIQRTANITASPTNMPARSRVRLAIITIVLPLVALGLVLQLMVVHWFPGSGAGLHPPRVTWGESNGSAAAIHIIDVSAAGCVVTLSVVSDAGFPAHDLAGDYAGNYGIRPLPSEIPAGLTGFFVPTLKRTGDEHAGETIQGTNTARGPGTFRFGFLLPDERTAATAADMTRRLYEGKTCRLDHHSLGLFRLESSSTGIAGQPGNVFSAQLILLPSSDPSPSSLPTLPR